MRKGLLFIGLLCVVLAAPAAAQTVRTAGIEGRVTDQSGAAVPGVTVTLTSPALQVPSVTRVTEGDGNYQFAGLPQGTYRVAFELAGFTTLTREEIILTAGFTARVDTSLTVGALQESVTVTGGSPLVDVTTTRGGGTLSEEALASIPNGYTFNDILTLTPGLLPRTPSQAGHIGFPALSSNYNSYGFMGQERNFMDGVNFHSSEGVDFAIAEEVDTKTFGTSAETPTAGAQISIIVKSGGNNFHGRYRYELFHDALIAANVDEEQRRQGVGAGNALVESHDFVGDLGGRLIRDKLWFYAAVRYQENRRTQTGYASATGPDRLFGTADDVPGEPPAENLETTQKISFQPALRHRFSGMYNRGASIEWEALASRFRHRESTSQMHYTLNHAMGEWHGTLTDRLLVHVQPARSWYLAEWIDNLAGSPAYPSTLDRATQIETGQMFDTRSNLWRVPSRDQLNGTVSYFFGDHQLKGGFNVWHLKNVYRAPNLPGGNYQLVFDTVAGVRHQPVQFNAWNRPVSQHVQEDLSAVFVDDTWRVTNRLTANMGLRVDRISTFANATTKEQGPFGGAGTFPRVDGGTWNELAPRFGASLDLTGDGKTVAKGAYGIYNWDFGDTFATVYSQNTQATLSYRWRDPNGDGLYQPGEIDLSLNGPDFISVSGATNPIVNPDLRAPQTHQISASIERELTSNLALRGLYVHWRVVDQFQTINPLRPFSAYNIPINMRDPGPDGVVGGADDGPLITIYDYDPAFRGSAFVGQSPVNRPKGQDDYANSFEATLVRRGGTIAGQATMLLTKNHRWLSGVPISPNDDFFPLDETWAWSYRAAGTYSAPYDVQVGVSWYLFNGIPGQRTNLFRGLPQSSTVTIRMEPFGSMSGPARQNLDLKLAKRFAFGNRRLEMALDVLNVSNGNAAWTYSQQSGPSFNATTSIAAPRTGRLSATFTF